MFITNTSMLSTEEIIRYCEYGLIDWSEQQDKIGDLVADVVEDQYVLGFDEGFNEGTEWVS